MDLECFELAGNGWTLRILFLNKIPSVFSDNHAKVESRCSLPRGRVGPVYI